MPITLAFTLTSLVALSVHSIYLRRTWLNQREQRQSQVDGDRRRIANAFLNMESTRFAINLCFLVAGAGLLFQVRQLGYLLALPPLLSILSSSFALRGIK